MRTALISALGVMLMLSACAKPPSQTRNACAIFEQRDGLFNNWRRAAIAAEDWDTAAALLDAHHGEIVFALAKVDLKVVARQPWLDLLAAHGVGEAEDDAGGIRPDLALQAQPLRHAHHRALEALGRGAVGMQVFGQFDHEGDALGVTGVGGGVARRHRASMACVAAVHTARMRLRKLVAPHAHACMIVAPNHAPPAATVVFHRVSASRTPATRSA